MNPVDITARGLALRAVRSGTALASTLGAASIGTADGMSLQQLIDESREGAASIGVRANSTAAELEDLSNNFALLTGFAGEIHTVETAPYLTRDHLVIRGNGAELRNVNQTPLSGLADAEQSTLPLGTSNVWATDALTYYGVVSTSGTVLTVAPGDGDNFAAGDLVIVHGATHYFISGGGYNVYRNIIRARVVSATATTITLDRMLPSELLADAPIIANAGEGISAGFDGPPQYYLLFSPHISNLTLSSDVGELLKWGGVIDGTFRDLTLIGRNGIALNAMQDCLIENIHVQAWRKFCELAEGSYGTTVRGLRGSLADASTKQNGSSDAPTIFIALGENSAQCAYEDFDVDSGPNDTTLNACQLGPGRNNEIRNSVLRFPAHTGAALAIQSGGFPGNEIIDCGYRNVTVHAPVCSRFFLIKDVGNTIIRPYLIDIKCFGTPTLDAGFVSGDQGVLRNVWCEHGALALSADATNWMIEGCYFPNGFSNLTSDLLRANPGIRDNESDASRRLNAAASIIEGNTILVTSTTSNNVYKSATFAAGDLKKGDKIFVYAKARAGGSGGTVRSARLSAGQGATFVVIGGVTTKTVTSAPMGMAAEITVATDPVSGTDTGLAYRSMVGDKELSATVGVPSLVDNDLTINVEYWCASASDPVKVEEVRIIPVKPGMRHLPVR
jgi:hypothetical protein